ncbi:amidase domain-containing protein [Anaerosolibacter sp.]|uniref:amidase domain-containing protein n=1 Tax=Anaerosolibacter sp. TaxID=1872527 RepID=UPI0039F0CB0D
MIYPYNRKAAVTYARKWALARNPRYADFEKMGGDCTNFASQVLNAGGCPMNYRQYGWYYRSMNDRAPAWTSVRYLHKFLIHNKGAGPVVEETDIQGISVGDLIQLDFEDDGFYNHTPVVVDILPGERSLEKILIAAHTIDRIDYPVANYAFKKIRFLHILGYRR